MAANILSLSRYSCSRKDEYMRIPYRSISSTLNNPGIVITTVFFNFAVPAGKSNRSFAPDSTALRGETCKTRVNHSRRALESLSYIEIRESIIGRQTRSLIGSRMPPPRNELVRPKLDPHSSETPHRRSLFVLDS